MSEAHLAIVLHAHLPFIHHPEHEHFLEEDWFFEAVTETYIPILEVFDRLRRDSVPFRITMSLTPPLLEMLANPLLQGRYMRYLDQRIDLATKETRRRHRSTEERDLAGFYLHRFTEARRFFFDRYHGNLINAFREFQEQGMVEVLACAATHALLPLMQSPNAVCAQVEVGVNTVARHLGRRPRGIWLPECAFKPGIDHVLAEQGIEYFLVDAHGILNAYPAPGCGVHAPLRCESGVAAFGRDLESSRQVWSSEEGYPGDGAYREFYRDLGYDASEDEIQDSLHADGVRRNVGIKYHRVTGPVALHEKQLYDRRAALHRAVEHGGHFVFCRQHQLRFLRENLSAAPIVVSPYDAELFGHWWYEGPEFLEQVFRVAQHVNKDFCVSTLAEYMDDHPPEAVGIPSSSSWGDKGYFEVWLNGGNDWIYRHLHKAERRMIEVAQMYEHAAPSPPVRGALNQAVRELLLAQSSDWAFLMSAGTAIPYAEKRTRNHLHRFTRLYNMVRSGSVNEEYVGQLYRMSPVFPDADYRVYL